MTLAIYERFRTKTTLSEKEEARLYLEGFGFVRPVNSWLPDNKIYPKLVNRDIVQHNYHRGAPLPHSPSKKAESFASSALPGDVVFGCIKRSPMPLIEYICAAANFEKKQEGFDPKTLKERVVTLIDKQIALILQLEEVMSGGKLDLKLSNEDRFRLDTILVRSREYDKEVPCLQSFLEWSPRRFREVVSVNNLALTRLALGNLFVLSEVSNQNKGSIHEYRVEKTITFAQQYFEGVTKKQLREACKDERRRLLLGFFTSLSDEFLPEDFKKLKSQLA